LPTGADTNRRRSSGRGSSTGAEAGIVVEVETGIAGLTLVCRAACLTVGDGATDASIAWRVKSKSSQACRTNTSILVTARGGTILGA
jgi:hypothetical protein